MDTKNKPVSIYAQYKCLPFLFNKQFTTHPLTVNLLAAVFTYRNLIVLWQLVRKVRLGCRDRSL
jgi:hypothetical protein